MKRDHDSLVDIIMVGLLIIVFLAVLTGLIFTAPSARAASGDIEAGKTTYQNLCLSCHGESGGGDGPVGKYLTPKPADLGEEVSEHDDEYLFKVVKEGGAAVGKSQSMPAWGGQLSDEDIKNVISYIKTFQEEGEAH